MHTTEDSVEILSLRCSVHTKSWQPGCAVCDQALLLSSKATAVDPRKMAVADRLLGRVGTKPTYAVELGLVGLEVARHVCHQPDPMTARQASQLMQTNLVAHTSGAKAALNLPHSLTEFRSDPPFSPEIFTTFSSSGN